MDDLLLNPNTRLQLKGLLREPPHAILLSGPTGSGKTALAQAMASALLDLPDTQALENYPYYTFLEPKNNVIPIESIRKLQQFLQLRTPGRAAVRRIAIVAGVDKLTTEGQNAFLKTLEEPPADTVLILTAGTLETVLPTIQSRATVVRVLPISQAAAQEHYFTQGFTEAVIRQAWSLSQGQAGLLNDLLTEAEEHELVEYVAQAKSLLGSSVFERLTHVDDYSKDKQALELLLASLSRIAQTAMEQAALQDKTATLKRWHSIATHLDRARAAAKRNANSKLLLTDLMLNL